MSLGEILDDGSPRTAELPRAFTIWEFVRGALFAWLWFQPFAMFLASVGYGIADGETTWGIGATLIGMPISFAATIAGSPVAFLLGLRLCRRRRDLTHVTAFALYGGAWGYLVQWLIFENQADLLTVAIAYTVATSAAVVAGWWTTSRLALRRDRLRPVLDIETTTSIGAGA